METEVKINPSQVIEDLNHAIKSRDPNPLLANCKSIQEYCSDFLGDGTVHYGMDAETNLSEDINKFCASDLTLEIEYVDRLSEEERTSWLVKYHINDNKSTVIGQIYISTSGPSVYRFYMMSSAPFES
ncbi:hypothetical protein [Roseibium alexandrii]|uniref:Uncharacterized protein n=1 Tax=Roseibium alexandrii TaxID=388408 RepID=A0A0M7AK74_9HYPH|nr:hypothetical protein [Roseibium alexandrii]CTQ75528.1 hypothetical protein LAX5112_04277 [Roseibium alexandrii]